MPITIRTNLETDEEKNAKYKVKAEVLRKAYSQDSIAGGITKMEVDRLGDNILVDYLKGADVYLTDILAYSNYNKMLDDLAEKVDKSLRGMERYEDIYEDERIKDKMEWVINYDDKPYHNHIICLYGHTHQGNKFFTIGEEENPFMYNVGVDAHDCTPVSIEEINKDIHEKVNELYQKKIHLTK